MSNENTPTVIGRLFQARAWREYAQAWDRSKPLGNRIGREWMQSIFRVSRAECLRRARVSLYLARRLNRAARANRSHP